MAAIAGAGDAAAVIGVAGEDGFGGFPDGVAVLVEGEFIEDEIAGEAAGGAGIGGEDLDAAGAFEAIADEGDADFHAHVVVGEVGRLVTGLHEEAEAVTNVLAFEDEFGAVFAGVGEDGDEPGIMGAEFVHEAVHGPGGEDVAFAELPGPMEDEDAAAIFEDAFLVAPELKGGGIGFPGRRVFRRRCDVLGGEVGDDDRDGGGGGGRRAGLRGGQADQRLDWRGTGFGRSGRVGGGGRGGGSGGGRDRGEFGQVLLQEIARLMGGFPQLFEVGDDDGLGVGDIFAQHRDGDAVGEDHARELPVHRREGVQHPAQGRHDGQPGVGGGAVSPGGEGLQLVAQGGDFLQ